jgi:tRNA-binding protein
MTTITYEKFERVNLRSGTIVTVEECPRAKKPEFKVWADFGPEIGILMKTSAQIHDTLCTRNPSWTQDCRMR